MEDITRRSFITSGAVAAAAAGTLACASSATAAAHADEPAPATQPGVLTADTYVQTPWNFEIAPDPIPESQIAQTVSSDVVVIGCGTAGLVCALACAQNGMSVTVVCKGPAPNAIGGSNHAYNTKTTRELGIVWDPEQVLKKERYLYSSRTDGEKWSAFVNNSGEAMDWIVDMMEARGYETVVERGFQDPDGILSQEWGSHSWMGGDSGMTRAASSQGVLVNVLKEECDALGVHFFFNTRAEQLVREDDGAGRVSATVALSEDGEYIRFGGTRAVVLATGDFSGDRDMVQKYCPEAQGLQETWPGTAIRGTGDGHKMALWAGAAWQKTYPCAPMYMSSYWPSTQAYAIYCGLLVNQNGKRFMNEDENFGIACTKLLQQPNRCAYAIWTKNVAEGYTWFPFGTWYGDGLDEVGRPSDEVLAEFDDYAENGIGEFGPMPTKVVKVDTLDEVAEAFGLDADNLKQQVAEYNEYARQGHDTQFYKRSDLLLEIEEGGPYYACDIPVYLLCITGGIRCSADARVLDENDEPIDGLFVLGSAVGDVYANAYTYSLNGRNLGGNSITMGYVLAKDLAANKF